ncbi:MAG: NUDIX pyrophosphatase [Ignavibacteriae bacterium HGW-Ignavibacteriae-3]|nr:MAG: NUDIX pyrophosphatase [Ignavibacteriae bacterium HGW-Ignavibacteriae-3]
MEITANLIEAHIFKKYNNDIEFLLLKRSDKEIYPGLWQMVTGSIDGREKASQAALREIREETGLTPIQFWAVPNINSFYSAETDEICVIPVFAGLVESDAKIIISEEHTEYRWVTKDEAKTMLAWPGQRNSVEIIADYFKNENTYLNFIKISV